MHFSLATVVLLGLIAFTIANPCPTCDGAHKRQVSDQHFELSEFESNVHFSERQKRELKRQDAIRRKPKRQFLLL
jgi:hypothetical protein